MSGGNGNDRGNGATTPPPAARSESRRPARRPDKPTDLPPLRSFRDRLPWLSWTLVAVLGVLVLALVLNTLDFSRREQLLERRLEIAVDERDELRDELETAEADAATTVPSTTSVPTTVFDATVSAARERELQDEADELLRRRVELDRREAELDEREAALRTTVPTTVVYEEGTFGDGLFPVGQRIPPGTYRTDAPVGCVWMTLAAGGSIIDSDLPPDAGIAELTVDAAVDRVASSGCGTWTLVE